MSKRTAYFFTRKRKYSACHCPEIPPPHLSSPNAALESRIEELAERHTALEYRAVADAAAAATAHATQAAQADADAAVCRTPKSVSRELMSDGRRHWPGRKQSERHWLESWRPSSSVPAPTH
jgi:hypothetical protein